MYFKVTFSMLNNSLLLVQEPKIVLTGYRKSYPKNQEMYPYLTFDTAIKFDLGLYFNV
jgi:hypothetical protein